jgi:hypothetical protein
LMILYVRRLCLLQTIQVKKVHNHQKSLNGWISTIKFNQKWQIPKHSFIKKFTYQLNKKVQFWEDLKITFSCDPNNYFYSISIILSNTSQCYLLKLLLSNHNHALTCLAIL